jgi:hypothetical protein
MTIRDPTMPTPFQDRDGFDTSGWERRPHDASPSHVARPVLLCFDHLGVPMSHRLPPRLRTTTVLAAALLAAVGLTACGGSGGDTSSSSAERPAAGSGAGQSSEGQSGGGQSGGAARDSGGAAQAPKSGSAQGSKGTGVTPANLAAAQEQLARTASVALQVKNIGQAVAKVRATTATAEGIVLSENIGTGGNGTIPLADSSRVTATTYAEIAISVPSTKLDQVVAELSGVGTVIRSTTASENVGSQIVDTQSRLETMRVSVERVRAFLKEATDLNQIVAMEAELTRRQSDLEALEAQLASLKGSVARSPIQISLTTEPGVIAQPEDDATGFLAGLNGGWKAFTASVNIAATIVGALLPFTVLAILLALPAWLVWRRRRPTPAPPTVLAE